MEEVTTSEAVRGFGMHPATVLRLILTKRVAAWKDRDGRWKIRRADLEAWKRSRHQSKETRTHGQAAEVRV
jgi:excisionase family DNA binding protein